MAMSAVLPRLFADSLVCTFRYWDDDEDGAAAVRLQGTPGHETCPGSRVVTPLALNLTCSQCKAN